MSGQIFGPLGVLPAAGGGGSLSFTPTANPTAVSGGGITSPASFASVAIGTASSSRIVVVCVTNKMATGTVPNSTVTGVTIDSGGGAVSMTQACIQRANQHEQSIWWLLVTSGTTATIAVTISSGTGWSDGVGILVGALTGSAAASVSSTVTATPPFYPNGNTNSNAAAITVATGGVTVISAVADDPTAPVSWANATTDYDLTTGSPANLTQSMAHAIASATVTETVSSSGGSGWISASFQP